MLMLHQAQQQGRKSLNGLKTDAIYFKKMEFGDHQFICMVLDQGIK